MRPTKKQKEEYEKRAVYVDGDLLPPEHPAAVKAKKDLRKVEQAYVNATIDDFIENVDKKREEIEKRIEHFANTRMNGKEIDMASTKMTEFTINSLIFNSLNPLSSKEPKYNAEKLAIVYELYEQLVTEVNIKICHLLPSKSHFCRFAGITTATYNGYKISEDPDMQIVISKIDDMLVDAHLTLAEEGTLNALATKYRMNVEMDKRENYNPQVVVKAEVKNLDDYKDKISSLKNMVIEGSVIKDE